jgi:hypothetical protein
VTWLVNEIEIAWPHLFLTAADDVPATAARIAAALWRHSLVGSGAATRETQEQEQEQEGAHDATRTSGMMRHSESPSRAAEHGVRGADPGDVEQRMDQRAGSGTKRQRGAGSHAMRLGRPRL